MRIFLLLFFCTILFIVIGCKENASQQEKNAFVYYEGNEYDFSFLVFDKKKTDTFFANYTPISYSNIKLLKSISELRTDKINNIKANKLSKQTNAPNLNDYQLSQNVLNAALAKDGSKYFTGSIQYLFFNNCLPGEFSNKWFQGALGDFHFNTTFFLLLRKNSKTFDGIIYGSVNYHDNNLLKVFPEEIFNEITRDNAILIKQNINASPIFSDKRLQPDKGNFIYFLDKVITGEWRLILLDNN